MADRDRDEAGKPRNRRPRDALGRPLPHGSPGMPRIPDDLDMSAVDSLSYAQQLLDDGLAFSAHEVLEAAWKNAPEAEREMWQGLAQLAVGITHIQRGNPTGAASLLDRAADRLARSPRPAPHGVACERLTEFARTLAADLTHGNDIADIAENRLRPQLRRDPV